jgi:hypothetical protein
MTTQSFQTTYPELNEAQRRMLFRELCSEVIGDDVPVFVYIDCLISNKKRSAVNKLKAQQRKRLASYLGVEERQKLSQYGGSDA